MNKRPARIKPEHPLIASTRQAFAHQNSIVVARRRELHELERQQTEEAITMLTTALARKKTELADVNARITGLTLVIERR